MLLTATFWGRLRIARFRARMKATVLAETVGVTSQTISRWEHGRHIPHLTMIRAIAQALRVSPSWLAWGEGEP